MNHIFLILNFECMYLPSSNSTSFHDFCLQRVDIFQVFSCSQKEIQCFQVWLQLNSTVKDIQPLIRNLEP